MASHSRDNPQDDSAPAGGGAEEHSYVSPDAAVSEDAVPAAADSAPGIPDPSAAMATVEDDELIGMLEQLNETLDSAKFVLDEHQQLTAGFAKPESEPEPERMDAPVQSGTPPQPGARSVMKPMLAAALGVCIGAAGLGLLWPVWMSSPFPVPWAEQGGMTPGNETRIAKPGLHVAPPTGERIDPTPLPAAKPPVKPIQERAPQLVRKIDTALTMSAAPAAMDTPEAVGGAPDLIDKPDFEEKDETISAPVPGESDAPARPGLAALSAQQEAAFLTRGDDLMADGDVASARLVYEHAAMRGSAGAMYALARSFDPRLLKDRKVLGIKPDRSAALEWYASAARNGHDQADAMARELERFAER